VFPVRELRSYRHVDAPELRAEGDALTLSGYAAVFGQLSQNLGGFVEQVDPAAFDGTLSRSERNVLGAWNHNLDALLATTDSGTLRLATDGRGLSYSMDLDPTDPDAQRVAAKVRSGMVKGSSFSFAVRADAWTTTEQGFPLRTLEDVVLYELGPVASPAYLQTQDGGAAVALRSFSEFVDLPFEQVTEAAAAGRLTDLIARDLPEVPAEEPAPEPPSDTPGEEAQTARRGRRNPSTR
jgi:HK97 family phage prohead protease